MHSRVKSLKVDPDVKLKLVIQPPRKVSIALKTTLKEELDRLESLQFLTPYRINPLGLEVSYCQEAQWKHPSVYRSEELAQSIEVKSLFLTDHR